jgi:hypothetical protein
MFRSITPEQRGRICAVWMVSVQGLVIFLYRATWSYLRLDVQHLQLTVLRRSQCPLRQLLLLQEDL